MQSNSVASGGAGTSPEREKKPLRLFVVGKRLVGRIMALNALFQMAVGGLGLEEARNNALKSVDREFLEPIYSGRPMSELYVSNELEHVGEYLKDESFVSFVDSLIRGVSEHSSELEERISSCLVNWDYDRVGNVERIILKIASYEMIYDDDVKPEVAIDQAVRLGKIFCYDDGGRFINGVLAGVYRSVTGKVIDPERNENAESENEED